MRKINKSVDTILNSYEKVPPQMVEEFDEIVHSVCCDIRDNSDYDIDLYCFSQASEEDKIAAYLWIICKACDAGFSYIMKQFDPDDFELSAEMLDDALMSIFMSWLKTQDNNEKPIELGIDEINQSSNWRVFDLFGSHCFITYKTFFSIDAKEEYKMPLTYITKLVSSIDLKNIEMFDIISITQNIICPNYMMDDSELNTALIIIKTLYDRLFIMAPNQLVTWMEEEYVNPYRIYEPLLIPLYITFVNDLEKSFTNDTKYMLEAFRDGDIKNIDPTLTGALSVSSDKAIEAYVDDKESVDKYRKLRDNLISLIYEEVLLDRVEE